MTRRHTATRERGVVLIEMVTIGFAIVAFVLPVLMMTLSYSEAQAEARLAAVDAAAWVARHGVLPSEAPDGVSLTIDSSGDTVVVSARSTVRLLGIDFGTVEAEAATVGHSRLSPYRSGR